MLIMNKLNEFNLEESIFKLNYVIIIDIKLKHNDKD